MKTKQLFSSTRVAMVILLAAPLTALAVDSSSTNLEQFRTVVNQDNLTALAKDATIQAKHDSVDISVLAETVPEFGPSYILHTLDTGDDAFASIENSGGYANNVLLSKLPNNDGINSDLWSSTIPEGDGVTTSRAEPQHWNTVIAGKTTTVPWFGATVPIATKADFNLILSRLDADGGSEFLVFSKKPMTKNGLHLTDNNPKIIFYS